jgi:hypothetical protein
VNVDVYRGAVGGGNIELLFAGMTFPDDQNILMSKDMWVADR